MREISTCLKGNLDVRDRKTKTHPKIGVKSVQVC